MVTNAEVTAASAEPPQMNFLQRLSGIYFEPGKTFQDINRKSSWLAMFIIVSLLGMATLYVVNTRVPYELRIRKQMEMSPIKLSEEQIQKMVEAPPSPIRDNLGLALVPLGVLVSYLILAGIFLLAFVIAGASIKYKKALAFTFWGMGPPSIVYSLVGIVMMYIKSPQTIEINPAKNVASNLGVLVSDKAHPVLASLLGSIDIFSVWTVALLAIGFAIASNGKVSTKKAAVIFAVLWGILILGKMGWAAIFG